MARLYWRVKVNGKWTWRVATIHGWTTDGYGGHIVEPYGGVMEEQEFVQTGNGTVAQRLRELEEEE